MESVEVLLSPEFAEFTSELDVIRKTREEKIAEYREVQEQYNQVFKELKKKAADVQEHFEDWKKSQEKIKGQEKMVSESE